MTLTANGEDYLIGAHGVRKLCSEEHTAKAKAMVMLER